MHDFSNDYRKLSLEFALTLPNIECKIIAIENYGKIGIELIIINY